MIESINQTVLWIQKQIREEECAIVALSGGPDSALLLELTIMAASKKGFLVIAAHLNHGLRDEAEEEERILRAACEERKILFVSKKVACADYAAINHLTLEEAGRNLRYDFFASILTEHPGWILTGHHRNDQAETILFHLFRGAGARGLRGIPAIEAPVLRPLHDWKRTEILEACSQREIAFFLDKSNESVLYTRNWIRHELIPMLENRFDEGLVDRIVQTSQLIAQDDEFLNALAQRAYDQAASLESGKVALNRMRLKSLEAPILSRVIFIALDKQYGNRKDVTRQQIQQAMKQICEGRTGSWFQFSKNRGFHLGSEKIYWGIEEEKATFEILLAVPGETRVPGGVVETNWGIRGEKTSESFTIEIEYDKIVGNLFWRTKQSGDWFFLPRQAGRKKLKAFWIDDKVPQFQRNSWPLLAVGKQIYWIVGRRKCVADPADGARVLRIGWKSFEGGVS